MSVLVYLLHDDLVVLVADTLASESGLGPLKFVNKVFSLPYLNTLIAGTGIMDLAIDWYSFIQKSIVAKDIVNLDKITQNKLSDLYKSYKTDELSTATIYQFGFCKEINRHIGFAYRSTNGFVSEKLIPSIGIKPSDGIDLTKDQPAKEEQFEDYSKRMAIQQKYIDDQKCEKERLGIGGDLYYYILKKDVIEIKKIYEFPDKNINYIEMLNKLASRNAEMF